MDTKSSRETCVAGGNDLRCYHEMIRGDQSFAKGGCLFFFFREILHSFTWAPNSGSVAISIYGGLWAQTDR